jgi:hypothetical protein
MTRVGRCIILLLMTADACHRRSGVDPVDVAGRTSSCHVSPGQRESRGAVIEAGRPPCCGCMADGAVRGKRRKHVPGTHDSVVICLMAGNTLRRRPLIAVVLMALRAKDGSVSSCQWELRLRVIK